jgi:hypothetical protein
MICREVSIKCIVEYCGYSIKADVVVSSSLFCFAWLALYTLSSLLLRLAFKHHTLLAPFDLYYAERPVCVSLIFQVFRRAMTQRYRCNSEAAMTNGFSTLEAACLCNLPLSIRCSC